jgi:hypothetical protein
MPRSARGVHAKIVFSTLRPQFLHFYRSCLLFVFHSHARSRTRMLAAPLLPCQLMPVPCLAVPDSNTRMIAWAMHLSACCKPIGTYRLAGSRSACCGPTGPDARRQAEGLAGDASYRPAVGRSARCGPTRPSRLAAGRRCIIFQKISSRVIFLKINKKNVLFKKN